MSNKDSLPTAVAVITFCIGIAAVIGWIMNIVKIMQTGFEVAQWGGFEVARVIGVFIAPLGAVIGWM